MQQNQTGKTKTAMLLELESIKDLLVEEDDIPILQEVVLPVAALAIPPVQDRPAAEPQDVPSPGIGGDAAIQLQQSTLATGTADFKEVDREEIHHAETGATQYPEPPLELSPTINLETSSITAHDPLHEASPPAPESKALYREEQQQDFFPLSIVQEPAPATHADDKSPKPGAANANLTNPIANSQRPIPAKASGQNPFLPEHIRARLQGNNPTSSQAASAGPPKKVSGQQQLIDDMVDKLLPTLEKELRQRLEGMSKRMLEDLLDEKK